MKIERLKKKDVIKILILIVPFILIGLFFGQTTIVFLFVLSAILLDLAIFLYPSIKYFGIELVTFTIVLIGFIYGPSTGTIAGLALLILHLIIARYSMGPYIVWLIPEYAAIGFLSGVLKGIGLINVGIYLTLGVQLTNIFLSFLFDSHNFSENLLYSMFNSAFNIFLFLQLGSFIVGII